MCHIVAMHMKSFLKVNEVLKDQQHVRNFSTQKNKITSMKCKEIDTD